MAGEALKDQPGIRASLQVQPPPREELRQRAVGFPLLHPAEVELGTPAQHSKHCRPAVLLLITETARDAGTRSGRRFLQLLHITTATRLHGRLLFVQTMALTTLSL